MQIRYKTILAAGAAFVALGLPLADAASPGAEVSFPAIARIEQKLNLTADQKAQFEVALAASKTAFLAIEENHKELKAFAEQELANTRHDLELLAAELDDAMELGRVQRHNARAEWLKLYAMLSDDQVAVVKTALQEKIAMVSWIRDLVINWFVARRG
jgi:hypothetical protein